jgi:hypothetical protein
MSGVLSAILCRNETDIDDLSDHFRLGQMMPEGGIFDALQFCIVKSDGFYSLGSSLVHILLPPFANTYVFYSCLRYLSREKREIGTGGQRPYFR